MHNVESAWRSRLVRQLSRIGSIVRNVSLVALGLAVAMLVVRGVRHPAPHAVCRPAPAPLPAASAPPTVAMPPSLAASPPSCPAAEPPPPAPPPRPVLSSPDGAQVVDRGFPALSADGQEVAIVIRDRAGNIKLSMISTGAEETHDGMWFSEAPRPGAAAPPSGVSPAEILAQRIAQANQRLATFATMAGTELGLTPAEVLATGEHATTLQVGELAVHHRGPIVSIRRTAAPRDVVLELVDPDLDTTAKCVPYAAAAYAADHLIAVRFDRARCADQGSEYRVLALRAPAAPPVPAAPGGPRLDLANGVILGLPAIAPDGSAIAIDAPLRDGVSTACSVNLLRPSDGAEIRSIATSPPTDCVPDQPVSPARRAMLEAEAARLAGWRTLPAVAMTWTGGQTELRQGHRLWPWWFTPIHKPPAREDCGAPPRLVHAAAWHVGGSRLLFAVHYATGGCMCDRDTWQVESVPGFGTPAAPPAR